MKFNMKRIAFGALICVKGASITVTRLSEEAYQPKQFEKAGPPIVPTNVVPTIASTTTP